MTIGDSNLKVLIQAAKGLDVTTEGDWMLAEIKRLAMTYAQDNFEIATRSEIVLVEIAMLIGASVAIEATTRKELK